MSDPLYFRELLHHHGYEAIPLKPNSKIPICQEWTTREADEQWKDIPSTVNIGIRCGGRKSLCVIDCDDKNTSNTFDKVTDVLGGFGLKSSEYPVVQTASGIGRHIYLTTDEPIPGGYCHLSEKVGSGEIRFGSKAQVVAPLSMVCGETYRLISGDFAHLPCIHIAQLSELSKNGILNKSQTIGSGTIENPSSQQQIIQADSAILPGNKDRLFGQINGRKISDDTYARLNGTYPKEYKSRSESELATIIALLNEGFQEDAIEAIFRTYPCSGKFSELLAKKPKSALSYLRTSINNGIEFTHNHESEGRKVAREIGQKLLLPNFPEGVDPNSKAVLIAFVSIAYESGKTEFHASFRRVAELSGHGLSAVKSSRDKLIDLGMLTVVKKAVADRATWYRFGINLLHLLPHPFEEMTQNDTWEEICLKT